MPPVAKPEPRDLGVHVKGRPLGLFAIVLYKVVWGGAELAGGVALLFSYQAVRSELLEDPQGLFIRWILSLSLKDPDSARNLGILLVGLGLLNFAEAIVIWLRSWKVRRVALVLFGMIGAFGLYSVATRFGALKSVAVAADIAIFVYIWKALPRHIHDAGVK